MGRWGKKVEIPFGLPDLDGFEQGCVEKDDKGGWIQKFFTLFGFCFIFFFSTLKITFLSCGYTLEFIFSVISACLSSCRGKGKVQAKIAIISYEFSIPGNVCSACFQDFNLIFVF